jgi:hypothetical protein
MAPNEFGDMKVAEAGSAHLLLINILYIRSKTPLKFFFYRLFAEVSHAAFYAIFEPMSRLFEIATRWA